LYVDVNTYTPINYVSFLCNNNVYRQHERPKRGEVAAGGRPDWAARACGRGPTNDNRPSQQDDDAPTVAGPDEGGHLQQWLGGPDSGHRAPVATTTLDNKVKQPQRFTVKATKTPNHQTTRTPDHHRANKRARTPAAQGTNTGPRAVRGTPYTGGEGKDRGTVGTEPKKVPTAEGEKKGQEMRD